MSIAAFFIGSIGLFIGVMLLVLAFYDKGPPDDRWSDWVLWFLTFGFIWACVALVFVWRAAVQ